MVRSNQGKVGLTILAFFTIIAIIGPLIAPEDPNASTSFSDQIMAPPSSEHWLGTDDNGRDVLSLLILGTRISMVVGFAAAIVSAVIGSIVGISAGYFGGWTERILTVIDDWFLVIPFLPLAIVLATLLGDAADSLPLGRVLVLVVGDRADRLGRHIADHPQPGALGDVSACSWSARERWGPRTRGSSASRSCPTCCR